MRIITVLVLLMTTLTASLGESHAQNKKTDNKKIVVEEIVAIVGNETIPLSELQQTTQYVIEARKQRGVESKLQPAEEAFEWLLNKRLLTAYAKLDSLDKNANPIEDAVQKRIDQMVKEAGSIKELEKATGKAIFQLREDMKKDIQNSNLAEMMQHKITDKVTISHNEVETFFRTMNVDSLPPMSPTLTYAQIVKMPPQTEERKFEVRQKLLEYRERILKGEKMGVLARLYSQDGTRNQGGEYSNTYSGTTPPFAEAVRQLNVGQISEIVETEYGFHIIEVVSKKGEEFVVRHILRKPEFTVEEETKASANLDSLVNVVREGKMSFAEAAFRYSEDADTKMNGGLVLNLSEYNQTGDIRSASTKFIPDQVNPYDGRVLNKMKVGEISQPYQSMDNKGNIVYKIVKLESLMPAHSLNMIDDFEEIENVAKNNKQHKALTEWTNKAIDNIYIRINPEYLNYSFENQNWKKQSEKYAEK